LTIFSKPKNSPATLSFGIDGTYFLKSSASLKSIVRIVRWPISLRFDTSGVVLSGVGDVYSRMVHSEGSGAGGAVASLLGISTFWPSVSGPLYVALMTGVP